MYLQYVQFYSMEMKYWPNYKFVTERTMFILVTVLFFFVFFFFFFFFSSFNTSSHALRLPVLKLNAKTQSHWLSTNHRISNWMWSTGTQLSGNTFNPDEILRKLAYYEVLLKIISSSPFAFLFVIFLLFFFFIFFSCYKILHIHLNYQY